MLGNEVNLARGRTRRIDDEMGFDQRLGGKRAHQGAAGVILSDDAEEHAARPERRDVARHVAGATDGEIVAGDRENRSRRLRVRCGRPRRRRSRRASNLRRRRWSARK
jgi:hypothetical protein